MMGMTDRMLPQHFEDYESVGVVIILYFNDNTGGIPTMIHVCLPILYEIWEV